MILNWTEDPSRTMAWLNDIPVPGSQSCKGKEPEQAEWTKQTELNQHSSIMIDGDEEEEPSWHEVTLEDFLRYIHEKPEWLYRKLWLIHEQFEDVIEDCEAWLAESELSGQAKDGKVVLVKSWLDETTERLTQMTLDRDAYANKIAYDTLHPVGHTTAGGRSSSKSAKIPDPLLLTDGNEPWFEDWLLLMTQKLEANHDHYDSPQLCHAYVASHCDGKACKHITPWLWSKSVNLYEDSTDMLEHLKTIYDDLNWVTTVKNQFWQLYMKTTDWFHDFLSEFLYLTAEAGISDDDLKDELYHQLTTKLQELTMAEINSNGTFRQFTSFCSQTTSCLEVMSHWIQKNQQYTNSQGHMGTNASPNTSPTVKKETRTLSLMTTAQMNDRSQLMHEGKCFNCHEHGHLSIDCPKKQKSDLKELEQPAEQNQNDSENT